MIVYISGPMTGMRDHNKRGFEKAHKKLVDIFENTDLWDDLKIINPLGIAGMVEAEFEIINERRANKLKPQWGDFMRRDLPELCTADYVLLLKGWSNSRGASLEKHVADEIGIPCFEDAVDLFKAALEKRRTV
jgi:hypothetical protein